MKSCRSLNAVELCHVWSFSFTHGACSSLLEDNPVRLAGLAVDRPKLPVSPLVATYISLQINRLFVPFFVRLFSFFFLLSFSFFLRVEVKLTGLHFPWLLFSSLFHSFALF